MSKNQKTKQPFNPLVSGSGLSQQDHNDIARRNVSGILSNYHNYFDIFSEMIQNALDAIEQKHQQAKEKNEDYEPKLWINIREKTKEIQVIDNGIGMNGATLRNFLTPNYSFNKQHGKTRGYKGVGATYLAYGFGAIKAETKQKRYHDAIQMERGREWSEDTSGRIKFPEAEYIKPFSKELKKESSGTLVEIKLSGLDGERTKNLRYWGTNNATTWGLALRIKTPLGGTYKAKKPDYDLKTTITLERSDGTVDKDPDVENEYLWPEFTFPSAKNKIRQKTDIDQQLAKTKGAKGQQFKNMPPTYKKLHCIYEDWEPKDLKMPNGDFKNDHGKMFGSRSFVDMVGDYEIFVSASFVHSTDAWVELNNDEFQFRHANKESDCLLGGGIQMANDRMPQGDKMDIPLTSSIGYQKQVHVVVSFLKATPDVGRKTFHGEFKDIALQIASRCVDILKDYVIYLDRKGGASGLKSQQNLKKYRQQQELFRNKHPFPQKSPILKNIPMVCLPQQEQDVIVLFQHLLAFQIIKGLEVWGTKSNERYDSMIDIRYDKFSDSDIEWHQKKNSLGVSKQSLGLNLDQLILEYKYTFNDLLADVLTDIKAFSDIDLVVCWNIKDEAKKDYLIYSYLHGQEGADREYFGATHQFVLASRKEFEIICLKDLLDYIENPTSTAKEQQNKYT